MMRSESGGILFEAMVSLTILALAGGGAVTLLAAALSAEQRREWQEALIEEADRVMTATSLLTRQELDLRLGVRNVGRLLVTVSRPERALYRVAVALATAPARELLVTVVHRPRGTS